MSDTVQKIEAALAEIPPGTTLEPRHETPTGLRPAVFHPFIERPHGSNDEAIRRQAEERVHMRSERHGKRQALALEALNLCLTKPEHQRIKAAVLGAKTLCALLLGPTGCGKTTGARYLVRHVRHYWVRAIDLSTATLRHGLGEGLAPEIEQARNTRALVIDDVGHEKDVAALYDVLDWRYDRGLPTIVTSGLSRETLGAHLGAEKVRRIADQHVPGMQVLFVDCHGVKP